MTQQPKPAQTRPASRAAPTARSPSGSAAQSDRPALADDRRTARRRVVRDLVVFQIRLFLDGLKDFILAPLSLFAGLIGLFSRSEHPGRHLYRVMRLGRAYEQWIDLYAELRRAPPALGDGRDDAAPNAEADRADEGFNRTIERLERALAAQTARGGLTARGKAAVESALETAIRAVSGRDASEPDGRPHSRGGRGDSGNADDAR